MQKTIFLSVISLIAGLCIGVVAAVCLFAPVTSIQSSTTLSTTNISTPTPLPSLPPITTPSLEEEDVELPPSSLIDSSESETQTDNLVLLERANQAIAALRDGDHTTFAALIHPVQGIIFTPYSTVDVNANLRFAAGQVASLESDNTLYLWGMSDGSPIQMTMKDYLSRYVYNADYAQAPLIGIDQLIGSGNALENVQDVYPDAHFVEYHFPSLSPEQMGFDWCSLKLVFVLYEGEYRLIGAIHSEWTA